MRTSVISRSAIAVATLAIGSAAIVAAPAEAAAPSGVTRADILATAATVRTTPSNPGMILLPYGPAANRVIRTLINNTCSIDPNGPEIPYISLAAATAGGASADGFVVSAVLVDSNSGSGGTAPTGRRCSFGVLAPVAGRSVLTGAATLTGAGPSALSGDAYVTPPLNTAISFSSALPPEPTFSASGAAVQSTDVKVADKKTKKEKKAAKKKYDKKLKSLKKSYKKALDKAGSSKSKKKAATKAYSVKKKAAKAKYKYAIANYKIVVKKTATPFSVTAKNAELSS